MGGANGMNGDGVDPAALSRRSPVYRELAAAGARFVELCGGAVAEGFAAGAEAEARAARRLALADLSLLPCLGFRGREALDWLRRQGVDVGDRDNRAYRQPDGALAARLAPDEALVVDVVGAVAGDSGLCERLAGAASIDEEVEAFPVPRGEGYFRFLVSGDRAAAMFAKVCGVDLRPDRFPPLAVARTSMARTSVVVVRDDLGATPAYHVLGDAASASYMLACLRDAMAEFDGALAGLGAVRRLAGA